MRYSLKYRNIRFSQEFLDALWECKGEIDSGLLYEYFRQTRQVDYGRLPLNQKYVAEQIGRMKAGVFSVEELRRHRPWQIEALGEALRLFESIPRHIHQVVTPLGCAVYASTYIAFKNERTFNAKSFYTSHLKRTQAFSSKEYAALSSLRPCKMKDLNRLLEAAFRDWHARKVVSDAAIKVLRENSGAVIKEFGLSVQQSRPVDAAVVVFYLNRKPGLGLTDSFGKPSLGLTDKFIGSEFGLEYASLVSRANILGMFGRRERKRAEA